MTTGADLAVPQLRATRRFAFGIDGAAVAASLGFNLAAAPSTFGGYLVGAVAPLFLFAAIGLWHRAHGVLGGVLGGLFNLGLAAVAGMAGFLSFDHIRHVAIEVGGQSPTQAATLALVVDVLAVLAALVVIGTGQRIEDLEAAEHQAELERLQADKLAEVERAEAERLAAIEAERVETDRAERERLAVIEAETERQRIEAEAEATRLSLEAEQAAAERARLEAEAETARQAAAEAEAETLAEERRKTALEAAKARQLAKIGVPASEDSGSPYGRSTGLSVAERVELYLADHPAATRAEVVEATEADVSGVKRAPAWRNRNRTTDSATISAEPAHA